MAATPLPFDQPNNPANLLPKVLGHVRAGRFTPTLLSDAEFLHREQSYFQDDDVSFGRVHSLLSEIYDQAGRYDKSLSVIKELGEAYLIEFEDVTAGQYQVNEFNTSRLRTRDAARQKVMCCLAYCFALYRAGHYEAARRKLDTCERFLTKHLIDAREDAPYPYRCWGALARLHYFYGQVLREESEYEAARKRFTDSLGCIWNRLEEKKKNVPPIAPEKLLTEQLFANHCTAKVLAFGFGWTSMLQSQLSVAQEFFQSARVLLADSDDGYLVWQVELLFCAAGRARNSSQSTIDDLLETMSECSDNLKTHPQYYLQSLRHLQLPIWQRPE